MYLWGENSTSSCIDQVHVVVKNLTYILGYKFVSVSDARFIYKKTQNIDLTYKQQIETCLRYKYFDNHRLAANKYIIHVTDDKFLEKLSLEVHLN